MNDDADVALANERLSGLVGLKLVEFWMGGSLWLLFDYDPEVWVQIETPMTVLSSNGAWTGEPLSADAAGALLPLIYREVTRAWMSGDGALELIFDDASVQIPPDRRYESWHLNGPGDAEIHCLAGGTIDYPI